MTEKQSPTPSFDPKRSAAIRELLMEEVRASKPRRRPSARVLGLSSLAVLAGIAVSGTAAFAITGGAMFGALPAEETPAPAVTSTITLSPTPTPTPTPTPPPAAVPDNPPAPVVRVPTSCESLLPAQSVAAIIGASATLSGPNRQYSPAFYTDVRVGALECGWVAEAEAAAMSLLIVPDVSDDVYAEAASNDGWGAPGTSGISSSALESCTTSMETEYCNVLDVAGGYGIQIYAGNMTADEVAAMRSSAAAIVAQVSGFGAPAPLWQPTGATLRGANECDRVLDSASLDEVLGTGWALVDFAGAPEPIAVSSFRSERQVNAIQCQWTLNSEGESPLVRVSVLPGGASYFDEEVDAPEYSVAPEYPGVAYVAPNGQDVNILIDDGWIQISAPAASLDPIVRTVVANVGAD